MWRNDRERPDDPQTRERETQRLSRDEYDRPRYGSAPPQNRGANYERAAWSYNPQPVGALHRNGGARWNQGMPHAQQPQMRYEPQQRPPQHAPQHAPQTHSLDDVRAHDLMTRRVASVHPATSVERAARLMEECDCGALPVVGDNGVLIGMVTDRDIVIRVVARGREVRNAIVADCMTERVFACYANESLAECMRQMANHQVRRLPIVDDRGRLVGILAQGDLARHAGRHPMAEERRALAQVMSAVSEPGAHGHMRRR
jgi:CBS domain-containing protein